MLCVCFDGLYQFELGNIILCLVFPLQNRQYSEHCISMEKRPSYLRNVVELNENLVNLAVSELAHDLPVLVIGFFAVRILLTATLFLLIIVVHKVVLVVEIIFANIDVAKGVCDRVCRRGFEVLQKRFKGS